MNSHGILTALISISIDYPQNMSALSIKYNKLSDNMSQCTEWVNTVALQEDHPSARVPWFQYIFMTTPISVLFGFQIISKS